MLRVGEGEEQRHRDRAGPGGGDALHEPLEFGGVDPLEDFPLRGDPLRNAEAQLRRHKAGRCGLKPVIELGARLASDREGVLKALCGDEGHTGALALQHGIGGDGGAMPHDHSGLRTHALQTLQYGAARVVGCRKDLQSRQLSVLDKDDVRESAAGVDGYPHVIPILPSMLWKLRKPRKLRNESSATTVCTREEQRASSWVRAVAPGPLGCGASALGVSLQLMLLLLYWADAFSVHEAPCSLRSWHVTGTRSSPRL